MSGRQVFERFARQVVQQSRQGANGGSSSGGAGGIPPAAGLGGIGLLALVGGGLALNSALFNGELDW